MIATHPRSTGSRRGCLTCVGKQVLVDLLSQDYPRDHEVIIYRAATLPILGPEIRRVALRDLPAAELTTEHTVVLPPGVIWAVAIVHRRAAEFGRISAVLADQLDHLIFPS